MVEVAPWHEGFAGHRNGSLSSCARYFAVGLVVAELVVFECVVVEWEMLGWMMPGWVELGLVGLAMGNVARYYGLRGGS